MPLLLITGIILPMTFAPRWLQVVAEANPLYHAVEAGRSLFAGDLTDGSLLVAFASVLVLTALTLRWSITSVRRLAG
jgi:ABC-2 type transport system permease protein